MRLERLAEGFEQNLAKLCGQYGLEAVADPDTLAYYAERVPLALIEKLLAKSFGSAKNFARRLAESLRNHLLPDDLPLPGQIRFQPP
jgi:hypothetical protein